MAKLWAANSNDRLRGRYKCPKSVRCPHHGNPFSLMHISYPANDNVSILLRNPSGTAKTCADTLRGRRSSKADMHGPGLNRIAQACAGSASITE